MASNTLMLILPKKVAKKNSKLPIYKPLKIGISNYKKNRPKLLIGKFTKKRNTIHTSLQFFHK
jgi:hypothetical protein